MTMTTDQKLILKEAGNFLNATFSNANADEFDGFIYAGIINTAVAEGDTATLINYLESVRDYSDKLIK